MSRRFRRVVIVPGLALAVVLIGGLLSFVGTVPVGATTDTLAVTLTPNSISASSGSTAVSVSGGTSGATVTITVATGGGTVTGGTMTVSSGGTASGDTITASSDTPGSYLVTATESGANTGSGTATLTEFGTAVQLVFTSSPSSTTTAGTFGATVAVEDSGGRTVTNDISSLTLTITPGTGTSGASLTGCATPEPSGVFTVTGCAINTAGTGYELHATDGALAVANSSPFNIAGAAYQIGFTSEPSATVVAEAAFSTEPIVSVEDSANRIVTTDNSGSISLSLTANTYGGILTCATYTESISSGVANFANAGCRINKAGIYTLTATTTGLILDTAASSTISVGAGAATNLVFSTEPSATAMDRTVFAIQPVVAIEDGYGNIVTANYSDVVALALTTTNGASLTCASNTATAVAGVATFAGCSTNKLGTYTLTATDTTEPAVVSPTVSSSIVVGVGAPHKLVFTTEPRATAKAATLFSRRPVVSIEDAAGNVVTTNSSDVVTLSLTSAHGAALSCTSTAHSATAGVAAFAGCRISKPGTYRLTATDTTEPSVVTAAVSSRIVVHVGSPRKLVFTTEPSAAAKAGTVFATQPVVAIEDAGGNVATTNSSDVVTLSLTTANGAALACTSETRTASAGVATFAGCRINKSGTFTLTASSSGLSSAVSAGVTVAPATPAGVPKETPNEVDTVHPSGVVKFGSAIQLRTHLYGGFGPVLGNITVTIDGETLCSTTLVHGVANCTLSSSKIGHGQHTLVVTYAGQGAYYSRNAAVVVTVT